MHNNFAFTSFMFWEPEYKSNLNAVIHNGEKIVKKPENPLPVFIAQSL